MPRPTRVVNRGPAAAPENRRAILEAARRTFASGGYLVPLSVIAREAGVSQGVMYRHFGDRFDLAVAVFEQNFIELEACADSTPQAFGRVWRLVLQQTVTAAAFVELMVESRRARPDYDGGQRILDLFSATLPQAQAANLVPADVTVADVERAWRMAFGIVTTAESNDRIWDDLTQAGLLRWASSAVGSGPAGADGHASAT